jgi:hypothetical protein
MNAKMYSEILDAPFVNRDTKWLELVTKPNAGTSSDQSKANIALLQDARLRVTLMMEALSHQDSDTLSAIAHRLSCDLKRQGFTELAELAGSLARYAESATRSSILSKYITTLARFIELASR